jgi:hypothetical protein
METQIFHHAKIIIFKQIPVKETKILQRYYNSLTNLKFQHSAKTSSFKNPRIKMDLLSF